jgi:hypothetical protein
VGPLELLDHVLESHTRIITDASGVN